LKIAIPEQTTRIIPDINLYQNKKTVGTGMMDVALLVTNVNQLRHIINAIDTSSPYFYISLSLVIASIVLQIIVGILLAVNCRYDVKDCDGICSADRVNNWTTSLIFVVTAINVVLPALGIPNKGL
jgi:Ninjurin